MATRAGNTLYVASSTAAVMGKEKGMKAMHVASEAASSAAAVGKVKASATATTACNVANAGKRKAASVLNTAKSRLAKGSHDNLGSPREDNPASTSDYCRYEPEDEKKEKKGQAVRDGKDNASRRNLVRATSCYQHMNGEVKKSKGVPGRRKGRVSHQSSDVLAVKTSVMRVEATNEENDVVGRMSDSDPLSEGRKLRSKKSWLEVSL